MDDEAVVATDGPASIAAPTRRRLAKFINDKTRLLLFLTLVASVAAYLADAHWVLELSSHFRLQYLMASIALLGILMCFRDWWWSLIAVIAVVLNVVVIFPWYISPAAVPVPDGKPLRVLLSNVHTSNTNSAGLLHLLRSEDADVVVLQEIDHRWLNALGALQTDYPHRHAIPRGDNFGIGLWSRTPFTEVETLEFEEWGVPSIHARMEIAGRRVAIVATHPLPPASETGARDRNKHLQSLAALIAKSGKSTILLGDLNVTMWSPDYRRFVTTSGLVNARKGFGILPTWPTMIPIAMIPLDHCLVSPSIAVKDIRTGASFGSDHLPIIADLVVPVR